MPQPDTSHVCALTTFHRGAYGCSCGRWFGELTGSMLTYVLVQPALRDRLRDYQRQVIYGEATDLRDAIRQAAATARQQARASAVAAGMSAIAMGRVPWPQPRIRTTDIRFTRFMYIMRRQILVPGAVCRYCGGEARTLDHVLPVSRWPDEALRMSNLVPACKRCNSSKGARTPDEWQAARLAAGLCWPPQPREQAALASPGR